MKYSIVKKYKYRIEEDFSANIAKNLPVVTTYWISIRGGVLYLRKGYSWDGASGPTIDTKDSMVASLIHDSLYQLIKLGKLGKQYRKVADMAFRAQLIKSGMSKLRANLWYQAVRKFGGIWLAKGKEPVIYDVS